MTVLDRLKEYEEAFLEYSTLSGPSKKFDAARERYLRANKNKPANKEIIEELERYEMREDLEYESSLYYDLF